MKRTAFLIAGLVAAAFGTIGIFLPLLPTVPLMIFGAYCFARSSPALERRIVDHPKLKPHFDAWRSRGAISRRGKAAALCTFTGSAIVGLFLLEPPLAFVPVTVGLLGGSWIMSRPTS